MPRKIRELEADLIRAGFEREEGKGSHRIYRHPTSKQKVTMAHKGGDDAHHYQEKEVRKAIEKSKG